MDRDKAIEGINKFAEKLYLSDEALSKVIVEQAQSAGITSLYMLREYGTSKEVNRVYFALKRMFEEKG